MKTIRQYAVAVLIMLTSLLMGCSQKPIERVSAKFCGIDFYVCYYQDVPAAQFTSKPYVMGVLECVLHQPDQVVMVGDRCYLISQSEVTR